MFNILDQLEALKLGAESVSEWWWVTVLYHTGAEITPLNGPH